MHLIKGFFFSCCFWLFFFSTFGISSAEREQKKSAHQLNLTSGQVVVVAEGQGEPRSIGSYAIRLYAGRNEEFSLDDFLGGLVRFRSGTVEEVRQVDLDDDGHQEIIVIVRSVGSGSYLSVDAFKVSRRTISLFETRADLPTGADPVEQLRKRMERDSASGNRHPKPSCGRVADRHHARLPARNEKADLAQIREICQEYGLEKLWHKIESDPPGMPFASDGCSLWFDEHKGVSLYPACFLHDLKYWAGYPDEDVERLVADAQLMIDVACLLNGTTMAESMFYGTRVGGHEMYDQSFSWGFGRVR